MAHNFIEGIDIISDNTGNTPFIRTVFVASDGNDATTNGFDPNTPFKTLANAISEGFAIRVVVGEDQIYDELSTTGKIMVGDGQPVFDGQGIRGISLSSGSSVAFINLTFQNFIACVGTNPSSSFSLSSATTFMQGCVFRQNANFRMRFAVQTYSIPTYENAFIDQDCFFFTGGGNGTVAPFSRCVFASSNATKYDLTIQIDATSLGDITREWHSCIYVGQNIITTQEQIEKMTFSYFENCSFVIDGTSYADVNALLAAIPTAIPNRITSGANFKGSFANLEFRSVQANSSLLGTGKFDSNIGNVNEGLVFNESNVSSSVNVTFNSGNINLTDPLINGQIIWEDSFSRVVTNPKLFLNGTPDFINNIIRSVQSPDPQFPRKTTVEIETRDKNETNYRPIAIYRAGYSIGEDANGLDSGEDDYHEFGLQELRVLDVRVTMTIRA